MTLPAAYAWLARELGPRMLVEGLNLYGTLEGPGRTINSAIVAWADEVEAAVSTPYTRWAASWFNDDEVPWCGLYQAVIAVRANPDRRPERWPPDKYLAAASWATWGRPVAKTAAMLGDVLVFRRNGGHHVGQYIGEDATAFHTLGGNTRQAVTIARLEKDRCIAVRRAPYLTTPANVRKVHLAATGAVSQNEA